VVGDAQGDIGWTIIGPLPQRQSTNNPFTTLAHQDGKIQWLATDEYPRIHNPESNVLWTANGRVLGGKELAKIGNGGYALGVRGKLIRDKLLSTSRLSEQDMLAIQLDTDAELYYRWRAHLANLLDDNVLTNEHRREFKRLVQEWNGKAEINQAGFTLIRAYRIKLRELLLDPLVKLMDPEAKHNFAYYSSQYEYPLWRLVSQQPKAFLPKVYSDYSHLFLAAVDQVIADYTQNNQPLADQVWGKYNQVTIQHPLSRAVPLLSRFLDRPTMALPGEAHSPRVQGRTFGASERMVISPGNKEQAIFHMPGGQSGHPLSPFYEQGFTDWAIGNPTPLWAREPQYQLILKPKDKSND
jgi:penicillin amidase